MESSHADITTTDNLVSRVSLDRQIVRSEYRRIHIMVRVALLNHALLFLRHLPSSVAAEPDDDDALQIRRFLPQSRSYIDVEDLDTAVALDVVRRLPVRRFHLSLDEDRQRFGILGPGRREITVVISRHTLTRRALRSPPTQTLHRLSPPPLISSTRPLQRRATAT